MMNFDNASEVSDRREPLGIHSAEEIPGKEGSGFGTLPTRWYSSSLEARYEIGKPQTAEDRRHYPLFVSGHPKANPFGVVLRGGVGLLNS
jgi:hypothetical protein